MRGAPSRLVVPALLRRARQITKEAGMAERDTLDETPDRGQSEEEIIGQPMDRADDDIDDDDDVKDIEAEEGE